MKNKKGLYILAVCVFAFALFVLFRNNTHSFKRLSASVTPEEEKNLIIEKAEKYINDNIEQYDGKSEIRVKDLIINSYLNEEEAKDVTKDLYEEETRIFFTVNNNKLEDIYLKDELFSKLFKCSDVCYINNDNYIYYNNDLYQILRVDSGGNVYIVNNEPKTVNTRNIDKIMRNKYNELDKKVSNSVDLISLNDIRNSEFLKVEKDMLLSSPAGYNIYSVATNETKAIDVDEVDAMFVIKILNTVNYKSGNGTSFNPYIISE